MNSKQDGTSKPEQADKPYAMLGAGRLTASIWKSGDERSGWQYHFNVFRTSRGNGHVSQWFAPSDVSSLVKLARLLAFTLADDGCLESGLRDDLIRLAADLHQVELSESARSRRGPTNPRGPRS